MRDILRCRVARLNESISTEDESEKYEQHAVQGREVGAKRWSKKK